MKSSTKAIHQCDHCGKHYLVKFACEKHEQFCPRKAENFTPCFTCKHLIKSEIIVGDGRSSRAYTCDKMGVGVYPPKAVRVGVIDKYPDQFKDHIQMPFNCTVQEPATEPAF
ncbi:hypothetical protein [Dyadobacter sp. CY323]|uniref:hypothetical protein n=1 Tax=Dyadobacter sp. CY323 TaxID=2907302 RepID=UPI001F462C23|nr:hypothetical protein [Dyadobacter sp. CY323]MCE6992075.1 hypothetical protein [Dyadobacter sp. CY323]